MNESEASSTTDAVSHDNDNKMDVDCPNLIHTTHIHTVCDFRRSLSY